MSAEYIGTEFVAILNAQLAARDKFYGKSKPVRPQANQGTSGQRKMDCDQFSTRYSPGTAYAEKVLSIRPLRPPGKAIR